jgi:hypothetical protein
MTITRFAVTTTALLVPFAAAAQSPLKICSLLTPSELSAAGVTSGSVKLFPDDSAALKKGSVPGLTVDLRLEQCTTEYSTSVAAIPVRWSVITAPGPIDKAAWSKLLKAMDSDDKKKPDPTDKAVKVDGVDCEVFSWRADKGGKQVHAVNCASQKGARYVDLEIAQSDRAKLPSANAVKQLLDKMLSRL